MTIAEEKLKRLHLVIIAIGIIVLTVLVETRYRIDALEKRLEEVKIITLKE